MTLRVGIAGFGIVGKRRRDVINMRDDMHLVAVCDQTFEGEGALTEDIRYFSRYQDLLKTDLDILFVCMSNDIAAEVTIAGLKVGMHVFCEKPPGRDVSDIARVLECHRKRPTQMLKYGFNHRYHDSVVDALELLHSGRLGDVINLRGVYGKSQLVTFDQTSWRTQRALAGGGVLLDQGIHMVDLLRLFAGEFVDVHAFVENSVWGHDVEDNAYALMRTADRKVAMLHSSASQWRHRFQLEISMTRGALTLAGILSGSKSYGAETLTVTWRGNADVGDPREETTRYNNDRSWALEIDDFAAAIKTKKPVLHGSVDDAYKTMELVYRIYCADLEWRNQWNLNDKPVI